MSIQRSFYKSARVHSLIKNFVSIVRQDFTKKNDDCLKEYNNIFFINNNNYIPIDPWFAQSENDTWEKFGVAY